MRISSRPRAGFLFCVLLLFFLSSCFPSPRADTGRKPFVNSLGMVFVPIPAGTFFMGLDPDNPRDPRHEVVLDKSFYLQAREVTQAQWKQVMGKNPSQFSQCGDDCPVEQVSWKDALDFVSRLNSLENTDTYRLPTEAEWEYACLAGQPASSMPHGDKDLGPHAWFSDNSAKTPHPVGKKLPNAWGLYDMQGNVWEWCADWMGPYPREKTANPKGPDFGTGRVYRGGGWSGQAAYCSCSRRFFLWPSSRGGTLGLRLVKDS